MSKNNPSIGHNTYRTVIKSCRMTLIGWILSSLGLIVVFLHILPVLSDYRLLFLTGGVVLTVLGIILIITGVSHSKTLRENLFLEEDLVNRLELFNLLTDQLRSQPLLCLVDDGLSPKIVLLLTPTHSYILLLSLESSLRHSAEELTQKIMGSFKNPWIKPKIFEPVITWQELQIQMQRIISENDREEFLSKDLKEALDFAKTHHFAMLISPSINLSAQEELPKLEKKHKTSIPAEQPMKVSAQREKPPKAVPALRRSIIYRHSGGIGPVIFGVVFIAVLCFAVMQKDVLVTSVRTWVPLKWHEVLGLGRIISTNAKGITAKTLTQTPLYADLGGKRPSYHVPSGSEVTVLQQEMYASQIWYFINAKDKMAGWTQGKNLQFTALLKPKTPIYIKPNTVEGYQISPNDSIPYFIIHDYITANETWHYIRTITQIEGWVQGEGL